MSLVTCSGISKNYGDRLLFDNASFLIESNSKTTLIGENGTGKSTILKMIMGEIIPDSGNIIIENGKTIGYLPQDAVFTGEFNLLYSAICINTHISNALIELDKWKCLAKDKPNDNYIATKYSDANEQFEHYNGYALLERAKIVLKILGFTEDDFKLKTEFLSGGQKTRALLAKLLLSDYDLLLLDEPTNHLDIDACEKFVDFLNNQFKGAALIVSHDRYFIDQVSNTILEIDNKELIEYKGNYSDFSKIKADRAEARKKMIANQKKEIERMEETIQTLFSHRNFSARDSLVKKLNKTKILSDNNDSKKMTIRLSGDNKSGREVLKFENMTKSFDNKTLFNDVSLLIERGEKIGIVGPNGSGKSTFIKLINGVQTANSGILTYGIGVKMAYFAQEFDHLVPEKSVMAELIDTTDITAKEARDLLAKFLFAGDDAFKLVDALSGGEKCRLSLAKIMADKPNLLLLDEPTNHLDIASCEILENAINDYDGTVIVVSHDRYFLDKTTNLTIEIKDGKFTKYFGNYSYYKEKAARTTEELFAKKEDTDKNQPKSLSNRDLRNQLKPFKTQIKETEKQIETIETRMNEITLLLGNEDTYKDGLAKELTEEYANLENKLTLLLEKWEEIQLSIDIIESKIV